VAAGAPFTAAPRLEGIIPALETSHALHYALHEDGDGSTLDLICLSGRGDKDLAEVIANSSDA
jgi:tryptophan synthase beta chain